MSAPEISIVTPVLNAGQTLAGCIDSVLGQRGLDVELVVKDGGSDDGSLEIVGGYGEAVTLVQANDRGLYDAMNQGILHASGEVVGILNADDWYPRDDVLARVAEAFDDPKVDACYGDLRYVDARDGTRVVRLWRSGGFDRTKFYWGWMPPHPAFFVRRSFYEKFGLYHTELGTAADYEMMLRLLLKHRLDAVHIPEVLVHMRTGGVSNASLGNRLRANRMDRKAWKANGLRPYPWTLWMKPLRKVGQWVWK